MPARSKELQAFKDQTEEDRRAKIQSDHHIDKLLEIQGKCDEIEDGAAGGRVDAGRVGNLKLKADISFRLLSKVMPDLKAIEHSGEVSTPNRLIIERTERSIGKLPETEKDQPTAH